MITTTATNIVSIQEITPYKSIYDISLLVNKYANLYGLLSINNKVEISVYKTNKYNRYTLVASDGNRRFLCSIYNDADLVDYIKDYCKEGAKIFNESANY